MEAFIRKSKFKDTVKLNVFVLSLMKSKKLGETRWAKKGTTVDSNLGEDE